MAAETSLQNRLVDTIAQLPSCLVAFSGGVDSAVVAKAACLALNEKAVAVTGVSPSLASGELELAQRIARDIGIRHETVDTNEFAQDGYLENQPNRCWHCKTELYDQLKNLGSKLGITHILNGANVDDSGDFRPGMKAAAENHVRSPLIECGIDKSGVRALAKQWNLEVWDKPAMPCLSSRVVYGLDITAEKLSRIDAAERLLRELGLNEIRVRYHHDDLARIEVSPAQLAVLLDEHTRNLVARELREIGFRYVTIDLEGFRSGSFQQLVSPEELTKFA